MAKLTRSHVLFASSLLALAGCAKDQHPKGQAAYGEWQAAESGPTTGSDVKSAEARRMPATEPPARPYESASAKTETMPKSEQSAQALSDGQILNILTVVDGGEVDQAQVAQKKAADARVQDFAQRMIKQHTQSRQKGEKLSQTARISLSDSAEAAKLRAGSAEVMDDLSDEQAGDDFDKLYIKKQADQHAEVLDLLDRRLIPSATNASLKNQLVNTRTMVSLHLSQARDLQQDLATRDEE